MAGRCNERRAGIEADVRVGQDKRIAAEAFIGRRVIDDQNLAWPEKQMLAESKFSWRMSRCHSNPRLEPIAVSIKERNHRNRRAESISGQTGQVVVRLLGERIDNFVLI